MLSATEKRSAEEKPEVTNKYRVATIKGRVDSIANLSIIPCIICFLVFTRPTLYRFFGIGGHYVGFGNESIYADKCEKFAWLSNGAFEVTCDHRPLDIHAISAIFWLVMFTMQAMLIKFNLRGFHKITGKLGFAVAVVNIFGMFNLSVYDLIKPMPNTARPLAFIPFMWSIGIEIFYCTWESYKSLQTHAVDEHALWIYRAFIKTFTTPLIRFYPLALRYIFSTECMHLNRDRFVMGAMAFAGLVCIMFQALANLFVKKKFWDQFLQGAMVKLVMTLAVDMYSIATEGFFFYGMYMCWSMGPANYKLTDMASIPKEVLEGRDEL